MTSRFGLAAGTCLLLVVGWVAVAGTSPAAAIDRPTAARELFAITNLDRTSNGLKALAQDTRLSTMAVARSEDMIARDYFAHEIPPDGLTVVDQLESLGVPFVAAGENIAWNNANDFVSVQSAGVDFINSDHHRENLMDERWERMGTGVAEGGGKKMYTVLFMQTVPADPAAEAAKRVAEAARAARPQRVHGEQVVVTTVRSGLFTNLVDGMVRLFLNLR